MKPAWLLLLAVAASPVIAGEGPGSAEARGRLLYFEGIGASGLPVSYRLTLAGGAPMGAKGVACVTCHGLQGRGGRDGNVKVPDIGYGAMLPSRYSEAALVRAIREGIHSSGRPLAGEMPRWILSEGEMRDLLKFLRRLGSPRPPTAASTPAP